MSSLSGCGYANVVGWIPLVLLAISCGANTDGSGGMEQTGGTSPGGQSHAGTSGALGGSETSGASGSAGDGFGGTSVAGGASGAGSGGTSTAGGTSGAGSGGTPMGGMSGGGFSGTFATGGMSGAGSGGTPTGGMSGAGSGGTPASGGSGGGPGTSNCPGTYDLPNCVTDMASEGGGLIILDEKSYLLTESLILQNGVDIVGQGSGTVIAWDDSVKDSINAPLLFSSTVNDISLESLQLLCGINQDPTSSDLRNDHIGLYLDCGGDPMAGEPAVCNDIELASLEVAYCSHGIHIKGASGVTATDLDLHHNGNTEVDFFHNVYFRRVGNLTVKQTMPTSAGFHDSPRGHGIRGSHLIDVYFESLSVYDNADHGIHFDLVENVRFHNLDVRGNCATPSGTCAPIQCYGTPCEVDLQAPLEP